MCASAANGSSPGGDRPGPQFDYEPPERVATAIKAALARRFPPATRPEARLRALQPADDPDNPQGHYCLVVTEAEKCFVKVSKRLGNPGLEQSITDYLADRGVSVNRVLVAGAPLPWNGSALRVDVRPWIDGGHFDGSPRDLESICSTLSAGHRALRDCPDADAVREEARNRNERLAAICDRIATALKNDALHEFADSASWTSEYASWAETHRDWLVAMTEHFDPHLDRWPGAQCLHGQIHRYNVLFRSGDGAAVLVDFEDSVHVFAPAAWDLAYLVQRFCLDDDPSLSVARDRYSIIAKAYGTSVPGLTEMMRQTAWLSVAAILERHVSHDVVTPLAEYSKFVRLERQTRIYESVL
jgi:hypothetical protein